MARVAAETIDVSSIPQDAALEEDLVVTLWVNGTIRHRQGALKLVETCVGHVAGHNCASEVFKKAFIIFGKLNHFSFRCFSFEVSFTIETFSLNVGNAFGKARVNQDQVAGEVFIVKNLDEASNFDISGLAFNKSLGAKLIAVSLAVILLLVRFEARIILNNILDHTDSDDYEQWQKGNHCFRNTNNNELEDYNKQEVDVGYFGELHEQVERQKSNDAVLICSDNIFIERISIDWVNTERVCSELS